MNKAKRAEIAAAKRVLKSVNDFLSDISDIANETGFQVADIYLNSLASLHRELINKLEK